MKTMPDYLAKRYFDCDKSEKTYYFNLYLKVYFKHQKQL